MKSRTYIAFLKLAPLLQVTGFFLDVTFVVFKVHEVLSTKYKQYISIYICEESPVNMPDPIQKCFGYGQLWPLQPMCSQNQAGSYMPYPTSCTRFSSIFPKKAWIALRKTDLDPIWMVWSGSGETHQKASRYAGIIRPSFWQDTTSPLPVFPPSELIV